MLGVIFDVDGTLVDSVDAHARCWQEAFAYFGREIELELIQSQIGKGGDQLMPMFLSEDELEAFGHDLEAYRGEHWKKNYLNTITALPGVRPLFQKLRSTGAMIVLASSCKEEELATYKRITKIADLIDGETSASDVSQSKPAPDIFLAALEKIGVDTTTEVVVVGDSPYDAIAAAKIGLRTIGVRSGGFSDEVLWDAGVSEIFDGPQDLLDRFEESLLSKESTASITHHTLSPQQAYK